MVLSVTYVNCAPSEAVESNSENDQTFFNIFCKSLALFKSKYYKINLTIFLKLTQPPARTAPTAPAI